MPPPSMHLIIQYCNTADPARAAEFDECLRRNLANPHLTSVHNLIEPATNVPAEFRSHPKYREAPLPRWLTFRDALTYANTHLSGQFACLANLDIFLDDQSDWPSALASIGSQIVLCLARHEFSPGRPPFPDPGLARLAFAQAQDAWIFLAPFDPPDCDFEIGMLGCDNAFAERIKRAGRVPVNAATRLKIFHFDQARGKTHATQTQVHRAEQSRRPANRHPENQGQLLLPDIDLVRSIDALLDKMKIPDLERYAIICDLVSRYRRVKND